MNTLFSNKAKNSILLKMFFSLTAYVQTSIIFHCDEKEFWDIRLSTQPTKLQVFNFYFSVYAGRSGFCHCKKKEVTLTFIIKRRPSIRLSALIYTQLRRKKNTTKRPRTVILLQISEKDWTFLATYHGDHLSQTPFP